MNKFIKSLKILQISKLLKLPFLKQAGKTMKWAKSDQKLSKFMKLWTFINSLK